MTTTKSHHILLVEDNELNRDMLTRRLQKRGFIIECAENGQIGVDMARQLRPDLILMDMSLPVLDGWEATRIIRKDAEINNIPIIALTAHAMPGDEERAHDAGCDDYDTKPVDLERLLQKIHALLS